MKTTSLFRKTVGCLGFLALTICHDRSRAEEVTAAGAVIHLEFDGGAPSPALRRVATGWLENSARSVATCYGGSYPVKGAVVRLTPVAGNEVAHGKASGWNGPVVTLDLGREATAPDLADDWMLTHELSHLAFPDLAEDHHWLEEGLATYIEPIGRTRAGLLSPQRLWGDFVRDMPQGEPENGDQGLDHTHTWGRTYWGGALFCLRADVEIHHRTANRRGLTDALRAIVAAGGTIVQSWDLDRVIAVGDAATGVPVLREVYDLTKAAPAPVDLPALWKQLGVLRRNGSVVFDDSAPLARVRQAITGK